MQAQLVTAPCHIPRRVGGHSGTSHHSSPACKFARDAAIAKQDGFGLGGEQPGEHRRSALVEAMEHGVLLGADVVGQANWALARDGGIAAAFAFVAALLALGIMMRLLKSVSYTPYVIYRVILGCVLLVIAYT